MLGQHPAHDCPVGGIVKNYTLEGALYCVGDVKRAVISYETMIRDTLSKLENPDTGVRLRVYRSAINACKKVFGTGSSEVFAIHQTELAEIIQNIELEYKMGNKFPAAGNPVQDPQRFSEATGPSRAGYNNGVGINTPTPQMPQELQINEEFLAADDFPATASYTRRKKGIRIFIIAGLAMMIVSAVGVYWYFNNHKPTTPILAKAKPKPNGADQPIISSADSSQLLKVDFGTEAEQFTTKPGRVGIDKKIVEMISEKALKFNGKKAFFGRKYLSVDTTRIYAGKLVARVTGQSSSTKPPLFFVGAATYDSNKKLETAKPGTHRYFINVGKVPDRISRNKAGWFELSGAITETGKSHKTFRPTTAYVRPIIRVIPNDPALTIELKSFTLEEIR